MMTPFCRAIACALSASLALSSAGAFAQKKPPVPKAASAKDETKPAPSKADREKAKAAFKRGEEKFASGDFAGAAEAFKEANSIIPAPQASYRLALSLDKAGKTSDAAAAYKQFLDATPPEKMAEQKTAAETRFKELSAGTVKLSSTPAGAVVTVDGVPASGPTPLTLSLTPGAHSVVLSVPSHEPVTRELTIAAGTSSDVAVELKPIPPPAPPPVATTLAPPPVSPSATPEPPVKDDPPPSKVPAYVTLGLAGAGVVVGTIFGLKALSSRSDFKDAPTTSKADDTERNALIADMAFGVALTLGITGTVLLLSNNKKAEPAKTARLRLLPVLTPQTQGAAAVLRF